METGILIVAFCMITGHMLGEHIVHRQRINEPLIRYEPYEPKNFIIMDLKTNALSTIPNPRYIENDYIKRNGGSDK